MLEQEQEQAKFFFEFSALRRKLENNIFLSWEHCYSIFASERKKDSPNYDLLSLHLASYLASWGMYSSSKICSSSDVYSAELRDYDYLLHKEAVKMLLEPKYVSLWGKEWSDSTTDKDDINLLFALMDELKEYYQRHYVSPTYTLITTIIMGTMGCILAYNKYLKAGLKKDGIPTPSQKNNWDKAMKRSFEEMVNRYGTTAVGPSFLPKHCLKDTKTEYPQMRKLDCAFWIYGRHFA